MHKTQQHNPVVDMVQYQLDASIQLADVVFSGTEKIDRAVLDVTHQAVDSQLKLVRAITNMRDPSRMADLQSAIAQRPEKAMHCQQQIMSALAEMQTEFSRSVREYIDRVSHTAAEQVESAQHQATSRQSQSGEAMVNPFTGMMGVWEQAFREVSRFATQNMTAARSNVETAANLARDAASQTVEHVDEELEHPHAYKRATTSKKK
ncbi:Phasin [Oxalobacteraceae bacterium]